ncbi:MAG: hypothetical protein IPN03_18485 [Holophagales bacterium]|nr:hypothetical protein [Holophagales bacterium]
MSKANLTSLLEAFGASRESVLLLDKGRSDPRQLPYLDILRLSGADRIDGVVELGGRSVLYVVGDRRTSSSSLLFTGSWRIAPIRRS